MTLVQSGPGAERCLWERTVSNYKARTEVRFSSLRDQYQIGQHGRDMFSPFRENNSEDLLLFYRETVMIADPQYMCTKTNKHRESSHLLVVFIVANSNSSNYSSLSVSQ